jgi:hypothetical protein
VLLRFLTALIDFDLAVGWLVFLSTFTMARSTAASTISPVTPFFTALLTAFSTALTAFFFLRVFLFILESFCCNKPSHAFCPSGKKHSGNVTEDLPAADAGFSTCSRLWGAASSWHSWRSLRFAERVATRMVETFEPLVLRPAERGNGQRSHATGIAGRRVLLDLGLLSGAKESPDRATAQGKSMTASPPAILGVSIPLSAASHWLCARYAGF